MHKLGAYRHRSCRDLPPKIFEISSFHHCLHLEQHLPSAPATSIWMAEIQPLMRGPFSRFFAARPSRTPVLDVMPRRSRLIPSPLRLLSWFILRLSEYQVSFTTAHGWPLLHQKPCEMRPTLVQCLFGRGQETNTTRLSCEDFCGEPQEPNGPKSYVSRHSSYVRDTFQT
ncbi:hypothetical protein BKA81DRAFT_360312 [Phyllosticta paracitricarpa]